VLCYCTVFALLSLCSFTSILIFFRSSLSFFLSFFFFNDPPTTEIYTLSLHDALPIFSQSLEWETSSKDPSLVAFLEELTLKSSRSEEHTSELQSRVDLVCRLLLEKKKKKKT